MAWDLVKVFERRSFQERERGWRGKEKSTLNQYNNNKKSDEKKGCCCAVCVCVQHRFCNLPSATEGHGFLLLFLQIEHHQRETTIERDSIAKRGKRKSLSLRAPRAIFSQTQFEGGRNNSRMRPTCNFAIDPKTYRNKKKKDLQQKKREAASSHHRQLPQSTPAQPQPSPSSTRTLTMDSAQSMSKTNRIRHLTSSIMLNAHCCGQLRWGDRSRSSPKEGKEGKEVHRGTAPN